MYVNVNDSWPVFVCKENFSSFIVKRWGYCVQMYVAYTIKRNSHVYTEFDFYARTQQLSTVQ